MLKLFFYSHKFNRIIKKTLENSVNKFGGCLPKLYDCFYYGAIEINPKNLVVWYLFETDVDLKYAEESGLCNKISLYTNDNLISLGYPSKARVRFTTKEDIDNKADGDFRLYFQ